MRLSACAVWHGGGTPVLAYQSLLLLVRCPYLFSICDFS